VGDADVRLTGALAVSDQPDPPMLAPVERLAAYIAAGGEGSAAEIFATGDVTIIENFAPYRFSGPDAVRAWTSGMRAHLAGLSELRHRFGQPHNFSRSGDQAFFSLPTHWSGRVHGKAFTETGGWCFVLARQDGAWRIRDYGWAVTELSMDT
jgi:hypothetical protein